MADGNHKNDGTIVDKPVVEKARLAVTGVNTALVAPLETSGFRLVTVSILAALVGAIAGGVAFLLYKLIGLFTNLAFYGKFSFVFRSPQQTHLGWLVIGIPAIGGILIGIMAKYGSSKIKGHG